ncbi:MAG: molybdopterin molybdotransferase MoeA [Sphingobacterium sp.]|uniref:molybdopterin molybdotransferase MoeA n=1 Tax=Sphingobacterium sp. JB170 TaxID=1434842 RepID=UPI00097F4AF4|nr:molybdopterin molybdotransferase MoeA [Sphingobacterium sp. JB170]SJN45625.1 Molybdopterin biosynthesis protein MoeA [Sphingobacterium sp. JB170]
MNTIQQTHAIIRAQAHPFTAVDCDIDHLDRHVLDEDIFADRDYPPFDRVAMDGIALRYTDWQSGTRRFRIKSEVFAGDRATGEIGAGECFVIMTGAACPVSADTVIRKEDLVYHGEMVEVTSAALKPYQNIAKKAEDCSKGERILPRGRLCGPSVVALLAALGKPSVRVSKMPSTAIVTTGSEIVGVENKVRRFQIRNSNGHLLVSMLKKWNITPEYKIHVKDSKKALFSALEEALKSELVLINGGISAGDADYVLEMLQALDVEILVSRVAIKPGKPFTLGRSKNGTLVFALPGNPLSCMVTFILFVENYLQACSGILPERCNLASVNFHRKNNSGFDEFFPVRDNPNGIGLELMQYNGSGDITAGLEASGFGWHPRELSDLHPGQQISYIPY